jgi:Domain of unknown function (DUF4396)
MNNDLEILAVFSLAAGILSAFIITIDLAAGNTQKMWIMNAVWPITALYSGPLGLWFYYAVGRMSSKKELRHKSEANQRKVSMWQAVGVAAMHCGSGCTLGDIAAEWFTFAVPLTLFGKRLFGAWALDYILAFVFGIAFQYFTIKPMKGLSAKEGLIAAVKADALALTSWQIGMYGWMAVATFLIFGSELPKMDPAFWFMMQIAMLCGFLTTYPVNWWLITNGIKEKM